MALSYSTGLVKTLFGGGETSTGAGFGDALENFVIKVYSGTAPTNSDAAFTVSGTIKLLGVISRNGVDPTTEADPTVHGLNFGAPVDRSVDKLAGENWSFTGLEAGTASWFRLCSYSDDNSLSTTLKRIQGDIGYSSKDINLSDTAIVVGNTYNLNKFKLTWPV